MIKAGTYCVAVTRKLLKGSTIEVGDYVYITDLKAVPVKKDDPYLQRIFGLAIKVDRSTGYHEIPDNRVGEDTNGHKIYLVDLRGMEILSDEEARRMVKAMNESYENG